MKQHAILQFLRCSVLSQVHPVVESVSADTGSLAGGRVLHVQGHGFGNIAESVRVDIAGMPCQVLSATDSAVTCLTSAWDSAVSNNTVFPGGAGIALTQFTGRFVQRMALRTSESILHLLGDAARTGLC